MGTSSSGVVRNSFARIVGNLTEEAWRKFLQEGVLADKKLPQQNETAITVKYESPLREELSANRMEICLALSSSLFDGRFANNAWMQECPDPATKLTWDNAALMSAKRMADGAGVRALSTTSVTRFGSLWVDPLLVTRLST